jgi:hypothetical protein
MANEEHLKILKQGIEVWNQWRRDNPNTRPDLSRADLHGADFIGVDLSGARLFRTDLSAARLATANLTVADLSWSYLSGANFHAANLSAADLRAADLYGADLSAADLSGVNLSWSYLRGADFSEAKMLRTVLAELDLSIVKGLETVHHHGPSYIDIHTLYLSQGRIPEAFLRGAGVPDTFIAYFASLTLETTKYYSCFISYSSQDNDFVRRLHADLQDNAVRCWFAPEDMKIGDEIRSRIDQSIRLHDKLLVVLSEHSIGSDWVEDEVETAIEEERKRKETVLFPIRLDEAVMETDEAWAAKVRHRRHIGDFSQWKDHDSYERSFERLLRDLKAEGDTTIDRE